MTNAMTERIQERIAWQRQKLLECGRRIIPHLTFDDILQPQDYPALECDPEFRYEEGVLFGMEAIEAATRSIACASESAS
jgi:hypothetical protein